MLGMGESHEDWLALARDLIARGLGAPMLIVADGAPGLIKAIEHCWPDSDRQHCAVHRVRNLLAKLREPEPEPGPEPERDRVRRSYWQGLDDAINERDAEQRLQALSDELQPVGWSSAARCLADDPTRSSCTCATRPDTAGAGAAPTCSNARSARSTPHQGHGCFPGEDR